jgi:hypothetical protein
LRVVVVGGEIDLDRKVSLVRCGVDLLRCASTREDREAIPMASPSRLAERSNGSARAPSRSPAETGADDLAVGLSTKLGDLLLTDKEAAGLVIKGTNSS